MEPMTREELEHAAASGKSIVATLQPLDLTRQSHCCPLCITEPMGLFREKALVRRRDDHSLIRLVNMFGCEACGLRVIDLPAEMGTSVDVREP